MTTSTCQKPLLAFTEEIPDNIKAKAEARWLAKQNRDFATADALRNEISSLGYEIKDAKDGYEILKKLATLSIKNH